MAVSRKTATFCGRYQAVGREVPEEGLVSPSNRRIRIWAEE